MPSSHSAAPRRVMLAAWMSAWMWLSVWMPAARVVAARLTEKSIRIQSTASSQSDQDKALAAKKASNAFNEAMALFREGSAESLRASSKKLEEAARLYRATANIGMEATILNISGQIYDALGERQKALDYYNQSLPLSRAVGDRIGETATLNNLGLVYDTLGEKQKALDYFNQALSISRAVGFHLTEPFTLNNIGKVYSSLGEKQKALDYYQQSLALGRTVGYHRGESATLNNIGLVYSDLGEKQKALDYFNQSLSRARGGGDRAGEATALNNIGMVYSDLSEKQKALDYLNQSLLLSRAIGNRASEATTLDNTGTVYNDLGENQKALDYYQQSLSLKRVVGDRAGEATTLNNIGQVYSRLGENQKALDYYQQALLIHRAVGARADEAITLNNIGMVYSALGEKQKALDYTNQALLIHRVVGDRAGEATTLNNIGTVYSDLGEKQKALDYFNQALLIQRSVGDRAGEASTLNNIGSFYDDLGEKQKALNYDNQALPIQRAIGDRAGEATALNNIGLVYHELGEQQKALDYFNQALPIHRAVGDRAMEARTLNNIGISYSSLGETQKALDYFNQSLPLARAVGDRAGEAMTLNNISRAYYDLGETQKALDYANQALPLSRAVKNRAEEAFTLHSLMLFWNAMKKPRLAIFYGKQAVNIYQGLRIDIRGLDKELQKTFLKSHEETYRKVAELLIAETRLSEAQQVLDLLKEEEFFDFIRRDLKVSPTTAKAEYRPDEAKAKAKEDSVTAIGTRLGELEAKALRGNLTPEEEQLRVRYAKQLETVEQEFQTARDLLAKEVHKADLSSNKVAEAIEEERGLMDDLRELGAGTVALYTLVGEDKYYVILMTPQTRVARQYPIKAADLSRKIFAFREAIQNPKIDPLPLAQELYKILVAPVARDLDGAKSTPDQTLTLMWELDGVLRYVPIAALHDGKHYLVERFRNVVYTPASKSRLKDAVNPHWKGLGLGVSKEHTLPEGTFPALPAVPAELRSVIRDEAADPSSRSTATGVLPGKTMLDEAFTIEALKSVRLRYQLVHIASHFQFRPGDETRSYLLLGDGSRFTLAQLRTSGNLFGGVDLLTLSACNTAMGDRDANGKEIEGFGVMAQQQGAKAVVASLWPVADQSTQELMSEFYHRHEATSGITKAEALRQAQLDLLYGKAKANAASEKRGVELVHGEGNRADQPAFKANPAAPFAHPYYWAPFILIGNWK